MMRRFLRRLVNWLRRKPQPLFDRFPQWPQLRKDHLRNQPDCQVCGVRENVEVHHIIPVSFPGGAALELDRSNLITLCERDHFLFGHLLDWKARNPMVEKDATTWKKKIKSREYPK